MVDFFKSVIDFYSNIIFNSENYPWIIVFIIAMLLCSFLTALFRKDTFATEYVSYASHYILGVIICNTLEYIILYMYNSQIKYLIFIGVHIVLFFTFYYLMYPARYKSDSSKKYVEQEVGMKNMFVLKNNAEDTNNNLLIYIVPTILAFLILFVSNFFFKYKHNTLNTSVPYYIIYALSMLGLMIVISNAILFIISKSLHKSRKCQHIFGNTLVFLGVLFLFIVPTNMNFVNISPFQYGTIPKFINSKISNSSNTSIDVEPAQPTSANTYEPQNLIINQSILDYAHNSTFDVTSIQNLKNSELNCHESVTPYLNEQVTQYSNQIMNSIIEITMNNKINPSYLVTQVLGYNKKYGKQYSVANPDGKVFNIDMTSVDKTSMTSKEYAKFVFETLRKNFSPVAQSQTELDAFQDGDIWYTYFAFYTEHSIDYVTFYLNLDDKNNIIGVDYTMLRFINLTDISTDQDFSIEDYALELDNIYYSLFSDTLSRTCNLYDTLLTTNSYDNADLTYLKRYSCTYS
mgnify:FL=1